MNDIFFRARRGELTAIVGDVGSGKSSLLAALLGQMQLVKGESKVCGSISYTPQEAWLLNMTLRENILFGSEYEEAKYREVVKVCALNRDLSLMPDGDRTEIGERGRPPCTRKVAREFKRPYRRSDHSSLSFTKSRICLPTGTMKYEGMRGKCHCASRPSTK